MMQWLYEAIHFCISLDFVLSIGNFFGLSLNAEAVHTILPIFQFVMIWLPFFLLVLVVRMVFRFGYQLTVDHTSRSYEIEHTKRIPPNLLLFVLKYSLHQQMVLTGLGLLSLPLLYASLELPKVIINHVITPAQNDSMFPMIHFGLSFDRIDHLIGLCLLLLFIIVMNGIVKFCLNLYSGRLAERLLRRLRLSLYHQWRRKHGRNRETDVIPMIAQEVEPIGGFSGDIISQPVFQGGTFLVIVLFMFLQNPILGLAALSLLPVQIVLIPFFQRRVNALARKRIAEIRDLGRLLGDQSRAHQAMSHRPRQSFRKLEKIRWELFKWKFSMKALNNFLTALTPFFFYAIGGYLVIQGELTLGALVAVLAAFKDFSSPLRDLFKYYQTLEDVRVRYRELARFCSAETPAIDIRQASLVHSAASAASVQMS